MTDQFDRLASAAEPTETSPHEFFNMITIRSKFRLTSIVTTEYNLVYAQKKYIFTTQYDESTPEDRRFCKATPSGTIEMLIDNPVAQAAFTVGHDYYFDVTTIA